MASPYSTILLDTATWDLTLDASGNIARADPPYSCAQDMATAIRLPKGRYIYDVTAGVDEAVILGQTPSLGVIKSAYAIAAGKVPGTSNVVCYIESVSDRLVTGQVQADVETASGTAVVAVGTGQPQLLVLPS